MNILDDSNCIPTSGESDGVGKKMTIKLMRDEICNEECKRHVHWASKDARPARGPMLLPH